MTLAPCSPDFVARLATVLPPGILAAPEPRFLEEPRGAWHGQAGAVARPRATAEVAAILRACNDARVPVVPYSGGTGLVGGQIMPAGPAPLVLSLERMAAIRGFHAAEDVIVAEAGVTLADLRARAEAEGRLFPLSLASEGSCRIGGNLATNAGGVNVLRYGNARDLCLGIEAVMADGSVMHGLKRLRKDNTGYDLRNLLIGSEGTLGVITAAALRLYRRPASEAAALIVVPSPQAALALLGLAQETVGPALSAFELISGTGLDFLARHFPDMRQPFDRRHDWLALVDLGCSAGQAAAELMTEVFAQGLAAGLASDGVIAQSGRERAHFWALRETIPLANRRTGAILSNDISLPLSEIPGFLARAGQMVAAADASIRINCFGHLGDGNLHYNLFPAEGRRREDYAPLKQALLRDINDLLAGLGGSFSAEHGLGRLKVAELERYGDMTRLAAMRAIKAALDPRGILNPGAVLRA